MVSARWRSRKKPTVPMGSKSDMVDLPLGDLGEGGVVRIPSAGGAVIALGPLFVRVAADANTFHEVWIRDVVAAERDEIAEALLQQFFCVGGIDTNIQHERAVVDLSEDGEPTPSPWRS